MNTKVLIVFWLICSFLCYGITFGNFYGEFGNFNYREHMGFSMLLGIVTGPFGLIVVFFITGFCQHGLRFK